MTKYIEIDMDFTIFSSRLKQKIGAIFVHVSTLSYVISPVFICYTITSDMHIISKLREFDDNPDYNIYTKKPSQFRIFLILRKYSDDLNNYMILYVLYLKK